MLFVYSLGLPVIIITTVALASGGEHKNKWHQFHVSILGLFLALQFTSFFTDLVKVNHYLLFGNIKIQETNERSGVEWCWTT